MYTSNVPALPYTLMLLTTQYFVGGTHSFELLQAPVLDYLDFADKEMALIAKKNILDSSTKGLSVIALFKED